MMDAPNDSSSRGHLDYLPGNATSIPRANATWGIYKMGKTTVNTDVKLPWPVTRTDGKPPSEGDKRQMMQQTEFICQQSGCDQKVVIRAWDEYELYLRLAFRGVKGPLWTSALSPQTPDDMNSLPQEQYHKLSG